MLARKFLLSLDMRTFCQKPVQWFQWEFFTLFLFGALSAI